MEEQTPLSDSSSICTSCGACCDGTLFSYAKLQPDDDVSVISSCGTEIVKTTEKYCFNLPCSALKDRCCQIYHLTRPDICSAFRCKTLRQFENKKISYEEAVKRVEKLLFLKQSLRGETANLIPNSENLSVVAIRQQIPENKDFVGNAERLKIWGKSKMTEALFEDCVEKYFHSAPREEDEKQADK